MNETPFFSQRFGKYNNREVSDAIIEYWEWNIQWNGFEMRIGCFVMKRDKVTILLLLCIQLYVMILNK